MLGDEALDLVDAGGELRRDPDRLPGSERRPLDLQPVMARAVPAAVSPLFDLHLETVDELPTVADHERDRPRPYLAGLQGDRELAEPELETATPGSTVPVPAGAAPL